MVEIDWKWGFGGGCFVLIILVMILSQLNNWVVPYTDFIGRLIYIHLILPLRKLNLYCLLCILTIEEANVERRSPFNVDTYHIANWDDYGQLLALACNSIDSQCSFGQYACSQSLHVVLGNLKVA